ncbi:MAG: hypothetical protein WAU88_07075 [Candidatus Zixiibacteriota bacterium]
MNGLFQRVLDWVKLTYLEPSVKLCKIKAAIYYLEGVKKAHRILLLICLLVFVITLIGAGLVMIPLALILFMPWEPTTRAIVGICIGAVYLLGPAIALSTLLSEKRWMRMTGASEVLRKLAD